MFHYNYKIVFKKEILVLKEITSDSVEFYFYFFIILKAEINE